MSCNLKQALVKVEELLKFPAIQKNTPFEIKRIKFEIEAMMAAKKRMLEGPTDETYTTEKVEIDHGTDYTKLITSLENRVKYYAKYVTKDTKNINVHRSTKDANGQTKYLPFGNPFSRYTTGEVDDSILSAMFYRWVVNNEVPASFLSEESTDTIAKRLGGINSARRKIIDELKSIAGKELYYEGTARGKNLSHASTLALIADLYGKGSLTINSNARQNVLTKSTTNKVGQSTENKQTSSIDATPMRLPYGASNDNNSKTSRPTPEFDTLPEYVPGQKNMIYAGIGSRKTPPEVITQMTEISNYLDGLGYKLQTGKTFNDKEEGADEAFSKGASNKELFGPEQANAQTIKIAKEIHPAPQNLKPGGLKLMARNTYQIFGSNLDTPVDFVLFYAKEGKGIRPEGGTGQAVEMARLKGIPTVNMADNNWRVKLQEVLNNKKLSNKETVKNAEVKPTEDEKIKKPDSRYKTSETELALDEYLSPDLTPEASTKSEDSIIPNKAPDTEHKVTIDEITRCLNSHKG